MSTPEAANGNGAVNNDVEGASPVTVVMQYLKDLSFENPHAPESMVASEAQPSIDVSVNVSVRDLRANLYEVVLKLAATATREEQTVFIVEAAFAGVFALTGVTDEYIKPVLLIECPRLLFPFARAIVADATRDGGFPPLMIQPVDFTDMYRRQIAESAQGE